MTAPVTILLSTWNGAAHLPAQLASFQDQTHPDWCLRWRDDGSADDTRHILAGIGHGRPLADDGRRLGAAASFAVLLRAHLAEGGTGLVAFADQDDVWRPEKLARAVDQLAAAGRGPALYCARQTLVDASLRPIGASPPFRRAPGFPASLAANVATGCTVVLDEAAQRLVARVDPPPGTLHDWWAYLVVSACGGRIVADDAETILYRQHGGNAVGAPGGRAARAVGALRRGPARFMSAFRGNVAALGRLGDALSPEARRVLPEIARALDAGPLARARLLRRVALSRQTAAETALFRAWFVLGGGDG